MNKGPTVWVFNQDGAEFAGGVFSTREKAVDWIRRERLTGVLTCYPLDEAVFDWSIRTGRHGLSPGKLAEKRQLPSFIGGFTTAAQEHEHFRDGEPDVGS